MSFLVKIVQLASSRRTKESILSHAAKENGSMHVHDFFFWPVPFFINLNKLNNLLIKVNSARLYANWSLVHGIEPRMASSCAPLFLPPKLVHGIASSLWTTRAVWLAAMAWNPGRISCHLLPVPRIRRPYMVHHPDRRVTATGALPADLVALHCAAN